MPLIDRSLVTLRARSLAIRDRRMPGLAEKVAREHPEPVSRSERGAAGAGGPGLPHGSVPRVRPKSPTSDAHPRATVCRPTLSKPAHTEQTEPAEQTEQTEHTEQTEQTVQTEPAGHTEHAQRTLGTYFSDAAAGLVPFASHVLMIAHAVAAIGTDSTAPTMPPRMVPALNASRITRG